MSNAVANHVRLHPLVLRTPRDKVAHLLRRAGFGATTEQIDAATNTGLNATIGHLVDYERVADPFTPPDLSSLADKTANVAPLTEWWLGRMISTQRPLQEKMTLFWHGHFATAVSKVRRPALMYRQNQLFRQNALGRFDDILTGVYKDPAMLIWLDGRSNTAAAANENFGREVMELFTLGRGQYTEDDVHANSRAFTGWRVLLDGTAKFAPKLHDNGSKTLLGQTGNWGADDAVRILCAHPATGPFLAGKLWRFFASDSPPASVVTQMASTYYASGHSVREMVRVMLSAPEFCSSQLVSNHVKSPTDFAVGALLQLGMPDANLKTIPRSLALLGQELFNPPNVGGWPGGLSWINGGTMLARFNLAAHIAGTAPGAKPGNAQAILQAANPSGTAELVRFVAQLLGVSPLPDTMQTLRQYLGASISRDRRRQFDPGDDPIDLTEARQKLNGLIHLLLVSPEYQIA